MIQAVTGIDCLDGSRFQRGRCSIVPARGRAVSATLALVHRRLVPGTLPATGRSRIAFGESSSPSSSTSDTSGIVASAEPLAVRLRACTHGDFESVPGTLVIRRSREPAPA